ncbi:hypothetical protein CPJCM30710_27630 [Clostridium polyendosporum]|uniref:Uncharacterized protein n=1 Tax=Clostridium polyendosporum TaxID=69208 RepID=A0A919S1J9_9CLOT|nr:hypothetical protein [Clostridium polyendosporum]GIM30097.1 hypothetical protein CPJCM30710_27630 [Clostridium polyendosporum]
MDFISTGNAQVKSYKCCVLFDRSDGAIQHIHSVVTMEGADETPEHIMEQRTLQLGKELGVDVTQMELLHVDPNSMQPNKQYAVDLSKRCLVAVGQPFDEAKEQNS